MWHLIGIDEDGARHHCRACKTEEEANKYLTEARPSLERMKKPYEAVLARAYMEHLRIMEMPEDDRPLYYDYIGWKDQGFFIDHFIIEYKEGDY
jgi:hypothetical protein